MITIFHNSRCRNSRAGLTYLDGKVSRYNIREYLKEPLSMEELEEIISKLDIPVTSLIRTQEDIYKKQYKGKELSDKQWAEALVKNPKMLQRPIVVKEHMAVLAQPPENIDKLL